MRKYIDILGKKYDFKQDWNELTLRDVITIDSVEITSELLEAYKQICKDKYEINFAFDFAQYVDYYKEVIKSFVELPYDLLPDEDVIAFYNQYVLSYVLDIKVRQPVTYILPKEQLKSFTFNGIEYLYPTKETIGGSEVVGRELNIMQFREATDLLSNWNNGADYEIMSLFVANYCLKKDEKYNENVIIERAKKFLDLPYDVVLNVFFYTLKSLVELTQDLKTLTEQEKATQKARLQVGELNTTSSVLSRLYSALVKRV